MWTWISKSIKFFIYQSLLPLESVREVNYYGIRQNKTIWRCPKMQPYQIKKVLDELNESQNE